MLTEKEKQYIISHRGSYTPWAGAIDLLWTTRNDFTERAKDVRDEMYALIREDSGLEFADYGDDIERWLSWLIEHDAKGFGYTASQKEENLRRRVEEKARQ